MLEKVYAMAKTKTDPDKTIVFVTGDRPGFELESARKIEELFCSMGYLVQELTPEEFYNVVVVNFEGFARVGRFAVIPHAESFPKEYAAGVDRFVREGGKLMVLGGPLFGPCDSDLKLPVFEGLCPFYKLYLVENCKRFVSAESPVSDVSLALDNGEELDVVCPVARSDGYGFDMDRNARIIPVLRAAATPDKCDVYDKYGEFRGSAAYFTLCDTEGRLIKTNGTRAGTVSAMAIGNAIAVVGIKKQDLLSVKGMDKLLCDMLTALDRGAYLFESGADKYVIEEGDDLFLGAKILHTGLNYRYVTTKFTVSKDGHERYARSFTTLSSVQNYFTVKQALSPSQCAEIFSEYGTYKVRTEITLHDSRFFPLGVDTFCADVYEDGADPESFASDTLTDFSEGEVIFNNKNAVPEERDLVKVSDGKFMLDGKEWIMYGYNYWPLYHVSLEKDDYWKGAFDKRNYIQSEVDLDLAQQAKMGLNCVAIRIDGGSMERYVTQLKDFFKRCEKYNLKVMLSACNITSPMYFQKEAFKRLLELTGVHKSPAMFSWDIAWEVGTQFSAEGYGPQWRRAWEAWLCEQFGSVEAAEKAIGCSVTRDAAGTLRTCEQWHYHTSTGAKAKLYSVYTHFLNNFAGRLYNRAVREIKSLDPNHLMGSRSAPISVEIPNIIVSGVGKHLDYFGLEGYTQTIDDVGLANGIAVTKATQFLTNNKPVTWIEYGLSLVGVSGFAADTKPKFDMPRLRPYDKNLVEQVEYQELYSDVFEKCGVKGSLPWFYAGGFRSTEHSDCGHINPDGTLRPVAYTYMERKSRLGQYTADNTNLVNVEVDPDAYSNSWCSIVFGKGTFARTTLMRLELEGKPDPCDRVYGDGLKAALDFVHEGKNFAFTTAGTGKTTADVPLGVTGNLDVDITPESRFPMKHLDSEFGSVTAEYTKDGQKVLVNIRKNSTVRLPANTEILLKVSLGNVEEATWLAPESGRQGGVYIASVFGDTSGICMPINADTPKFGDAIAEGNVTFAKGEKSVSLRAVIPGRTSFGEVFTFGVVAE